MTVAAMDKLLLEGTVDWLHMPDVLWAVRSSSGPLSPEDLKRNTMTVIGQLLESGWFAAGDLVRDEGFQTWDLDPAEALMEIKRRWDALGHEPDLGDVCWFRLLDEGRNELRRREAAGT